MLLQDRSKQSILVPCGRYSESVSHSRLRKHHHHRWLLLLPHRSAAQSQQLQAWITCHLEVPTGHADDGPTAPQSTCILCGLDECCWASSIMASVACLDIMVACPPGSLQSLSGTQGLGGRGQHNVYAGCAGSPRPFCTPVCPQIVRT